MFDDPSMWCWSAETSSVASVLCGLEHFILNLFLLVTSTGIAVVEKKTDLCGCVFEIEKGIMVCVKRCPKHSRPKRKRPFRSKAECVRP
jgi:hypothetical protein